MTIEQRNALVKAAIDDDLDLLQYYANEGYAIEKAVVTQNSKL